MATATETKVIEIKVPVGDAINQITALTAAIDKLTAETKELDKTNEAEAVQIEKNRIIIKDYQNQKRQLTNEVMKEVKTSNEALGAYQKLQNEYSKAASEAKNLAAAHGVSSEQSKKATERAFALGERLKEIDATVGQHQRNVGNYAESLSFLGDKFGSVINYVTTFNETITNATENLTNINVQNNNTSNSFSSFTQNIRNAGAGVLQFGKQLLILLANPIVAIIGGIVGAFLLLKKGLESNREGTEKLNQIFAVFKDVLAAAFNVIGKVAGALIDGVMAVAEFTGKLLSFIPAIKRLNDSNQESIRIERELQKLRRAEIVDTANDAILTTKIAELKKKMRQKDLYDEKQRLGFAREIDRLALADANDDKMRAEKELQLFIDRMRKQGKNSQTLYTEEEAKQFTDLIVKKESAMQGYYAVTTKGAGMAATLQEEINNDSIKKHEAFIKQKAELDKKAEEKRLTDLKLSIQEETNIINERIAKYEKELSDKDKTILAKVTKNAMTVLNASIAENTKQIAIDDEVTKRKIENAERVKEAKIKTAFDAANAGADILQGSFAFADALAENELNLWAQQNKGKANFDEEYAKKKAQIDHKQAVRNKVMQVVNSLINGAAAVVAQLSVPVAGPALAWAAGIAAALQTAAIIATPIPSPESTSPGSSGSSLAITPDLTSKIASPLSSSASAIQSTGGSNAVTSGAANIGSAPAFDYNAMANVMAKVPAPKLSIVELREKEKSVDFIENYSTIKS